MGGSDSGESGGISQMKKLEVRAVRGDGKKSIVANKADVPGIEHTGSTEIEQIRAGDGDDVNFMGFETLGEGGVEEVEGGEIGSKNRMGLESGRQIVSPAVEGGEIKGFEGETVGEEDVELITGGIKVRTLVPTDELDVVKGRPTEGGKEVNSRGIAGIEGEGDEGMEGGAEEVSSEVRVGGREGVSPGGNKGEVKVGYRGREAGGEHEDVAEVAAEGEGRAGRALQMVPLAGDEGEGVAAADGGDAGDYGGEDCVGEVVKRRHFD